jgi:hypothetical protein
MTLLWRISFAWPMRFLPLLRTRANESASGCYAIHHQLGERLAVVKLEKI